MKKIMILIALIVICVFVFLIVNYFQIRKQYENLYLYCISQKYDINDIEIKNVYFVLITNSFNCYYEQKSTGRHFMASKTSGGREHIIEYAYDSKGNLKWNDSWDLPENLTGDGSKPLKK